MNMNPDPDMIRSVVESVIGRLSGTETATIPAHRPEGKTYPAGKLEEMTDHSRCQAACRGRSAGSVSRNGVFDCVHEAGHAAHEAHLKLKALGVAGRAKAIEIIKSLAVSHAEAWGRFEMEETRIGRLDHKIEKLKITRNVPGTEWLRPHALSGDGGITLEERAPFGVIGAVLPVTHSVPTLTGNVIHMIAAGNSVLFNPHPGGARSAALAVKEYNRAIERELGIQNLITTIEQPTLESFDAICKHPEVALLAITGGPAVVQAAMTSGKRAICAGPGNPVVVVDESANLIRAARCVIDGASFDNNLLCIGEKAVFVIDSVFERFVEAMIAQGACKLDSRQLDVLTRVVFSVEPGQGGGCSRQVLNRDFVGADAAVLARHAGVAIADGAPLLFAETDAEHPFVQHEQMMPMIPLVRCRDFESAVQQAKQAEHSYRHSAMIHTLDVNHMTHMAREMDTTIFVKNGASVAGLGLGGEGYLSYSIATTTGEGITTPETFTRIRRCVLVENLRIV